MASHMRNDDGANREPSQPRAQRRGQQAPTRRQAPSGSQEPIGRIGVEGSPLSEGSRRPSSRRPEGKKRRNSSQILSTVLIVVGVGLLLVAGGMWGFAQWRYYKQNQITDTLQKTAIVKEADYEQPYPDIDWEALKAVNGDVCGWIFVPDTVISYPVYQGVDNDQYLRTSATGEWSVGGQIFLDWENTKPGLVDHQSIIYGHHMQDGTIFQPLSELDNQDKFDAIPTIWYLTEDHAYELEPLMMYYVVPTDTEVRKFRFESNDAFRSYLQSILAKAVTKREDAAHIISGAKHVLTMSTCNYYDDWGRSILVAVPKDEAKAALDGTTAREEAAAAEAAAQQAQQQEGEQPAEGEGEQPAEGEQYTEETYTEETYTEDSYTEDAYVEEVYYEE